MSIDPQEFGKVLARLDAQDRELRDIKQEMHELGKSLNKLTQAMCAKPNQTRTERDWLEILSSAIFGAVAYFVGQKLMGG